MSHFDLIGKKIFITGSTSGIGFEMSKEFNKLGACLTLLGRDQKMDRLEQLLENKLSYNFVKGDLNNDLDNIVSQIDVLDGIVFNES